MSEWAAFAEVMSGNPPDTLCHSLIWISELGALLGVGIIFGREGSQRLQILCCLISKQRPMRKGKLTVKLKGQLPIYT